ncbi:S1 RNA-binding domain-containing protein [Clostridium botulinum]|uniref:S1 motif domain-containing protein n=1 Tax=Clostridium botulinum TaxID=1491 RepID=A0A126JIS3_CLOBO|nr:S1 RNA-binding domain-containing protein [Clostridium botulinum]ALT05496.1 S1-like RNA-binding domain containing hypothetical protein [Clostridium botulinum]ALT05594.1 S1-like RNA-binding domain containing hypothetical protein [Clostridium botulinum]MBY6811051.1 S1 RNA-binding domain-containing protein [Clostridium botulinum]MBY6818528.1 S1 RNA-binding domain-containing protein [Clostridium botulinum]MBY6824519.1 S1 RNA-binding domain-containing protein [Clostridium botulinum]
MGERQVIELDDKLLESDIDYGKMYDSLDEAEKELKDNIKQNKYYSGLCKKCDPEGNLYVDINGVICVLERNEVSIPTYSKQYESTQVHKGLCQSKVGTYIKAKVLRVDNEGEDIETIYITRKDFVKSIQNLYDTRLTEGSIVTGKVTNIDEQKGVFVDIGGDYTGIIPRNYLENLFVTNLYDHVSLGEKVKVIVLELKKNSNGQITHLVLDRKSLLPKFNKLAKHYKKGDIVLAKIKSIQEAGIYCSLDKHLDIICDFDNNRYKSGQEVRVRINSVKYDKQRISGIIVSKI